jgi:hypothetical protein
VCASRCHARRTSVCRYNLLLTRSAGRDLARQLRRASASIALNMGEGMYGRGPEPARALSQITKSLGKAGVHDHDHQSPGPGPATEASASWAARWQPSGCSGLRDEAPARSNRSRERQPSGAHSVRLFTEAFALLADVCFDFDDRKLLLGPREVAFRFVRARLHQRDRAPLSRDPSCEPRFE